jgi:hypothetical protein
MKGIGLGLVVLTTLVGVLVGAGAAASSSTCTGGTIAPGTYGSLVVAGNCSIPAGSVIVHGGLTVGPGARLNVSSQQANLVVDGGVSVGSGGSFILGCPTHPEVGPPCHAVGNRINGGLKASGAAAVQVHSSEVNGGLSLEGGHGFFSVLEDSTVRGGVSVSGYSAVFLGLFRNTISGGATVNNITLSDQLDIGGNTISGNLACSGNSPPPHNEGQPNSVTGSETGQCAGI